MKTELQLEVERLRTQVEDLAHERDTLAEAIANATETLGYEGSSATALADSVEIFTKAIADATEALGHEGCTAVDLADSVGILQRVAAGEDIDCECEYSGLAAQVEAMVWLLQFAGTDGAKTKKYIARLSIYQS